MLRLPDLVSLLNLVCGISSISAAHNGSFDLALILLLLAAIADGADGYIARRFKGGELGENLDSLADAVSFGVAPALLIYIGFGGEDPIVAVLPTLIRRMWHTKACTFQFIGTFPEKRFEGLPITAGCVMLATYLLLGKNFVRIDFLLGLTLALSILMVSTVSYPKIRNTKILAFVASVFGITVLLYF